MSGADIKVAARPPIGTIIKLGRLTGKVVSHTDFGIRVEFVDTPGS